MLWQKLYSIHQEKNTSGFWNVGINVFFFLFQSTINSISGFWTLGQTKQQFESLTSGKLATYTLNNFLKNIDKLILKTILSSSLSHNRFVHLGNVRVYSGDDSRITNETSAIRLLTPSGHSLALACIGHVVYTRLVLKWVFLVILNPLCHFVLSFFIPLVYIIRDLGVPFDDNYNHYMHGQVQ